MDQISPKVAYWKGFRAGAPFLLVIVPFGMVFGVIATEAGFNIAEVMGFSVLVIAGAAQLAAVQLMTENAPTIVILATALAVNMRMAMYSAAMAPHLGAAPFWTRAIMAYFLVDQSYGASAIEFENRPDLPLQAKVAFFFGSMTPVCIPWYLSTWTGAILGASFPSGLGLDFAVPITFLAMIAPMLRTAAHVAAAMTSVVLAMGLAFLPYNLGLLLAAATAMGVGAWVEHLSTRKRKA